MVKENENPITFQILVPSAIFAIEMLFEESPDVEIGKVLLETTKGSYYKIISTEPPTLRSIPFFPGMRKVEGIETAQRVIEIRHYPIPESTLTTIQRPAKIRSCLN